MAVPIVRFLDSTGSLAVQVADAIWAGSGRRPVDFSDTEVWVPTGTASRRIRLALARRAAEAGTGLFAPKFVQPMAALLPDGVAVASRAEREGAWGLALRERGAGGVLFPRAELLEGERQLLGAGGMLCELGDLLAEGGWDFASERVAEVCEEDGERWEELRGLYAGYLRQLERRGLADPNALRLARLGGEVEVLGVRRVFIAAIPDLPRLAERWAEALIRHGVAVTVLVWRPGEMGGGFDGWGRPEARDWAACALPVAGEDFVRTRDPEDEAERTVRYLAAAESAGDYAVVLVDGDLAPAFRSEILRAGGRPFLPEGEKLAASEAGVVAALWMDWLEGRRLKTLRRLVECPRFVRWLGIEAGRALADLDELQGGALAETWGQVRTFTDLALVAKIESLGNWPTEELLVSLWADGGEGGAAAGDVLKLWREIGASPVFRDWTAGREAAFARALSSAATFEASDPGTVELLGWLEAPWVDATRLALAGCVEGRLPASVTEHAFLPDSRRRALGILDNAGRLARDAYLLTCLVRARGEGECRLSFCKVSAEGGPNLPSSLLLRCADLELPERVLEVFRPAEAGRGRPRRENGWRWRLPEVARRLGVAKISPTDVSAYLACPLRFYFSKVLRAEEFDARAREMDALQFGSLLHKALEVFGNESRDESKVERIAAAVMGPLAAEAARMFGPSPSPAVRVQLEAIKLRLRAFARVQAEEYAAGWRIIESERKLSAEEPDPLRIGPLPLSGKIDRIEEHPELGLRVVDYKSYASWKTPEKTHFGPASAGWLPEAAVEVLGKARAWVDLQLPLYRRMTERWYPGREVRLAYFVLPADPGQTGVAELELDDELYLSALRCAEAVAEHVAKGVFWPPREVRGNWGDPVESLFLNGKLENCFEAETVEFLRGGLE